MATDSAVKSVTNTLTSTTADAVTLTQPWPAVEITNHHATEKLFGRADGTTAVAAADGTSVILPGTTKVIRARWNASMQTVISVVGDGNVYTIEGVH